jgi:hypothetical protein
MAKEKETKKAKATEQSETTGSTKACSVAGCKRPYRAKGYCNVHFRKWRRGELETKPRYRTCREENCHKPTHQKGLCEQHYSAWSASKRQQAPAAEAPKPETPAA